MIMPADVTSQSRNCFKTIAAALNEAGFRYDIPVLGSGKTDYVVLQRMAAERFAEAKAA